MTHALIEVKLPASLISYDLSIPVAMQIGECTKLIASAMETLSKGTYTASPESTLCNQITGEIYNPNARVYETNIRNGTKLYLF